MQYCFFSRFWLGTIDNYSHVGWSPGKVEIDHHPQGRLWDQAGDLQSLLLFAEFLGDFLAISLVFPCMSTRNPHGKPCEINMNSICVGIVWAIMDSQKQTSSFHCAQCFWKGTFSEFHQSSRFDHPWIGDFDWGGGLSTLQLADLAGHPWVCRACWGFGFCRMHFLVECDSREIWLCLICDRFSLSETHDDSGIYIGTIFMTFYDYDYCMSYLLSRGPSSNSKEEHRDFCQCLWRLHLWCRPVPSRPVPSDTGEDPQKNQKKAQAAMTMTSLRRRVPPFTITEVFGVVLFAASSKFRAWVRHLEHLRHMTRFLYVWARLKLGYSPKMATYII